jgi:hypothetical protein
MSTHNNVNPDHYKVAGRERQGENVVHEVERREARRTRQGQGRAHGAGGAGISNRLSPDEEARDSSEHPPLDTSAPPPQDAAGRVGEEPVDESGRQTSAKSGSRSTAQKAAGARHTDEPAPPSRKVDGAFGREGRDKE